MTKIIFKQDELNGYAHDYDYKPAEKTLGEFLKNNFPDFTIRYGTAPLDTDITHGVDITYVDNRAHGLGESVTIYPYVKWSDGLYKPCHYWGDKYEVTLERH